MYPKDPTFFLFIKPPISSCKTYRTVVGVSDSLLSDPVIEQLTMFSDFDKEKHHLGLRQIDR